MNVSKPLLDFFALGQVAHETKRILANAIRHKELPLLPEKQESLNTTLSHLGDVREGFTLTLRSPSVTSMQELRYLVSKVFFDWGWVEEQGLELWPDDQVHIPQSQLLAFAHAYVTFATLPSLPKGQVTFPERTSYADIPVPRSPAEVLERIEEMEQVIWGTVMAPVGEMEQGPLRRTYGFFETGDWLIFHHLRLFFKNQELH